MLVRETVYMFGIQSPQTIHGNASFFLPNATQRHISLRLL